MYICVCTAVTERDIAECIQAGARTFEQIQFETGLATCCGQCSEHAREYIAQACESSAPHLPAAPSPAPEGARSLSRRGPLMPLPKAA